MEVEQEFVTVEEQDEVSGSRSRLIQYNQGGDGSGEGTVVESG